MADIYSTISLVAYILTGVTFIAAIIVFFTLNVRGTYMELRGQNDKQWVTRQQQKPKKKVEREKATKPGKFEETQTIENVTSYTADGEAVTVLESGEEVTELGLVGVYEPGTDIVEETTDTGFYEESATVVEDFEGTFKIVRKTVFVYSDEIIR